MDKMGDYEIRKYLHEEVLQSFRDDKDSVVVDELGILWGQSRIDIAVVNGFIHAYEIKSSVDTLDRLPRQLEAYRKVCDYITLAVSREKYNKMSSDEKYNGAGFYVFDKQDNKVKCEKIQEPTYNAQTDMFSMLHLLWREEALALLSKHGLVTGIKSKPKKILYLTLCASLSKTVLADEIRSTIKERKNWRDILKGRCRKYDRGTNTGRNTRRSGNSLYRQADYYRNF